MTRISLFLQSLLLLLSLALPASGWTQSSPSPLNANASAQQVQVQLLTHAPDGIRAGRTFYLGVQLNHKPGWHTYWRNPGDSGLPTHLEWDMPAGLTAQPILWPLPSKHVVADMTNYGFENQVLLVVPVQVQSSFQATGPLKIGLHASWLACENACIPEDTQLSVELSRDPQIAHATQFEAVFQQQPQALGPALTAKWQNDALDIRVPGLPSSWANTTVEAFPVQKEVLASDMERNGSAQWESGQWRMQARVHDMLDQPLQRISLVLVSRTHDRTESRWVDLNVEGAWPTPKPATALKAPQAPVRPASSSAAVDFVPLLLACLGALIGGLLLNLMPCVLPVLSIKAIGLADPQVSVANRRAQGLGFLLGVLSFMLLLALLLMGLRAAGAQLGWGFQLQSPWVIAALCLLFTLIGLNLLGVFEWPSFTWNDDGQDAKRHPMLGGYLSGALTVLIASPCTAPFMGASLGLALTLPNAAALLIFASLGLGLALPMLALAWIPQWSTWLPRPGAWMISLRIGLAFPMLATVLWLLWVLGQQTSVDAMALMLAVLLALAALLSATHMKGKARWLGLILMLSLTGALGVWLAQHLSQPPASAAPSTAGESWRNWSPEAVDAALKQGQPVFIDFTAAWCITCQFNEKTVLNRSDVQQAFRERGVAMFKADWTRQDPQITQALKDLGRSGVPVYVLQAPNQAHHLFSEVLNAQELLNALNRLAPNPKPRQP